MTGERRVQIHFSAEAWVSIGQLSRETFRRLRRQLDLLSADTLLELASSGTAAGDGQLEFSVSFDDVSARCRFDGATGILTLLTLTSQRESA